MMASNGHLLIVRVSTIVLLAMFLLPVFGQEDNQPTSEATTKTLADWIEEARDGSPFQQWWLGVMYEYGKDKVPVPQDYREARRWYRKAAEQGDASAQRGLGKLYYKGLGIPQDYKAAVRWYRLAAEQGDVEAQRNLALMYAEGQGVSQDYVRAHMWYNLAASRVTGEDRQKYARNRRDRIAEKMTADQIAEAQRLAREWKPRKKEGSVGEHDETIPPPPDEIPEIDSGIYSR